MHPQASVSVFKCGFYYYSGTIKSTDQETSGIEDSLLQFPRGEGTRATQDPIGKHRIGRETEEQGKMWLRAFIVVLEGRNR